MFVKIMKPRKRRISIEIPAEYVNHRILVTVAPVGEIGRPTLKDIQERLRTI